MSKLVLWSSNKKQFIDDVMKKLKQLRYKGGYYEEIGLPQVELVINGLKQDINNLVTENNNLKEKLAKYENNI